MLTRYRILGLLNYSRLALPRLLLHGPRSLHPDVHAPHSEVTQ